MVRSAGAGKHKAANKQNGNGFPDDLRRASHPHALLQKSVMNTDDFNLVERAAPNLFGSPSSATVPSPLLAPATAINPAIQPRQKVIADTARL